MPFSCRWASLLGFALVCAARTAAAAPALPGSAQPGLLEKRFEKPELPRSGIEEIVPLEREGEVAPPGTEKLFFQLKSLEIEGSTVYQPEELRPLYQDFLGRKIAVKSLYDIAQAITRRYAADGFALCHALVPVQELGSDGVARLRVVEGYVDRVTIQGDASGVGARLAGYADKIRASRPLRLSELERYLLLAGDLPGTEAHGVLKPSGKAPGAADLVFVIDRKPVDAQFSLSNRGGPYIGHWQSMAEASLNSVLGWGDRTSLQYAATPVHPKELEYLHLQHEEVIDDEGTTLGGDAGWTTSSPGFALSAQELLSESWALGLTLRHALIRSRARTLRVYGRFELRDIVTTQHRTETLGRERADVVRLGATYDWADELLPTAAAASLFRIELSQGLGGSSTSAGRSEFFKTVFELTRTQPLFDAFALQAGITGQWTAQTPLSSEQFAFGGGQYGRAYDPAEIVGNRGWATRAELQYTGPMLPALPLPWQGYAFHDFGEVWGVGTHATAASAGVGVRLAVTDWATVNGEIAQPLTRPVSAQGGKSARLFFGVVARY